MASFREVHAALAELLAPVSEQQASRLATYAAELDRALSGYPNGTRWQQYLRLAEPLMADAGNSDSQTMIDDYTNLLERFDAVSREPAYQAISSLSSFRATREAVAEYIQVLRDSPVESVPRVPTEELPPPPISE